MPNQLGKSSTEQDVKLFFRFCCVSCLEPSFAVAKKKKKWNSYWSGLVCFFIWCEWALFSVRRTWTVTEILTCYLPTLLSNKDREHIAYALACPCLEKSVLFSEYTDKCSTSCSPEYPHSGRNWWRFEWSGSGCPLAQDTCLRFPEWGRGWGICSAYGAPWGETQKTMSAAG